VSKDGRIGFRAALKALADILQIEGVQRMPLPVNRDQVQIVQPLLPPVQLATLSPFQTFIGALGLLDEVSVGVAGPAVQSALLFPTFGGGLDTGTGEARIIQANAQLLVSDSDVAVFAAANAELRARWVLGFDNAVTEDSLFPLLTYNRTAFRAYTAAREVRLDFGLFGGTQGMNLKADLSTGNQTPDSAYFPGLGQPLWLPAGVTLGFELLLEEGVTWGVDSELTMTCMAALTPKGQIPPL